jgi:hypothetical protein
MYTFLLLTIFTGSLFWYCSSEKVNIEKSHKLILTFAKDKTRSKILGIVLLGLSWILTMYLQGLLSGTLAFAPIPWDFSA